MANPEHVRIVKHGAEAIARWREDHSDDRLDLAKADLRGLDLHAAELFQVDLRGAHLRGIDARHANFNLADMRGADVGGASLICASLSGTRLTAAQLNDSILNGAHVHDAHLVGASLQRASLQLTDLTRTNLTGANLKDSNLLEAKLYETKLDHANLSGVSFWSTVLADVDLSNVAGLEAVDHVGPSCIGVDTLVKSKGNIPESFLRGCGFQPWQILEAKLHDPGLSACQIAKLQNEIFAARTKGPIYIGGVFISYARDDSAFVDKLYERLGKEGVSVWLDRYDMDAGAVERQVLDAIRINDIVLLVLSTSSVDSDWVEHELETAREKEKRENRDVLCPVALDNAWEGKNDVLWRQVRKKNILDFSQWQTKAFEPEFKKLIRGLKKYYPPAQQEEAEG